MLALQQNGHGDDNKHNNKSQNRNGSNNTKANSDKKNPKFSKKNFFQKNQSLNFRNNASKAANSTDLQPISSQPQPHSLNQPTLRSHLRNHQPPSGIDLKSIKSLSSEELALDDVIGELHTTLPSSIPDHKARPLPKFLLYQPPTLNGDIFSTVDEWDKKNQSIMTNLEQTTSDLSSLYEEFQKMRENERETMEKKGLVDNEKIRRSLENAIIFKGSCQDMCPVFERVRRSAENDVRNLEKDPTTNKISKLKAVKAFSRPAAGQPPPLPSDVRPPQVLVETLNYAIDNVLTQLPESQSFLWDRTRSIRQDFTYQNYLGPEAVDCNERIVRIHILTLHIMAQSSVEYSQQQELEQMNKALKTLSEMYVEYRSRDVTPQNEAEFRAYYMLSQIRDPELEREVQALPIEVLNDEKIQLVLQLRDLISMNIVERGSQPSENILNAFTTFFDMINSKKIPVLMLYLLEIHLNEIRFYAFKSMKKAIHNKARPYPLSFIQDLFAFNDTRDITEFCDYYGLKIEETDGAQGIDILSLRHSSHVIPDQKPFRQSYTVRSDSLVHSYQDLIRSGKQNTDFIRFTNENIPNSHVMLDFDSSPKPSVAAQPLSFPQAIDGLSFAPSTFTFGSTSVNETRPLEPVFDQEAETMKREELIRQEQESRLKKQQKDEEVRIMQEQAERKRLEEDKIEKMKKTMLEKQELKRRQRSQTVEALSYKLREDLIADFVKREVDRTTKPLVEATIQAKQQRGKLINSFSDGLYEAFINELVFFQSMVLLSDMFRQRQLKKRIIKTVKRIGEKCQRAVDLKKRKREELLEVIENFGVPRLVKKKRVNKNISYSDISNISTSTSLGSINSPESMRRPSPIDLKPFKLQELMANCRLNTKPYAILIYCEDSIIARLFIKKFALKDGSMSTYSENGKDLISVKKTDKINSSLFNNVNLLIFNLVGITNFETKRLEFKELLKGIQLNNNCRFEILVLYWDLDEDYDLTLFGSNQKDILKELHIPKNENILNANLLRIDSSLNLTVFEKFLSQRGDIHLSAKGLFNERYNNSKNQFKSNSEESISNNNNQFLKPKNKIDPLKFTSQFDVLADTKFGKRFKPHIEASAKYNKLPKLLSDQNSTSSSNNKNSQHQHFKSKIDVYSTPRPKSSELLQTPSYCDSSTASTMSNVTFETKEKDIPLIKKPTYSDIKVGSIPDKKKTQTQDEDKEDLSDGIIPKGIRELRELARKVKERHGKK